MNMGISLNQAVESADVLRGQQRQWPIGIHNLGIVAQKMGNYREARKLYQQSLKIESGTGGQERRYLVRCTNWACWHMTCGDYDEARKLYQQSLKI